MPFRKHEVASLSRRNAFFFWLADPYNGRSVQKCTVLIRALRDSSQPGAKILVVHASWGMSGMKTIDVRPAIHSWRSKNCENSPRHAV